MNLSPSSPTHPSVASYLRAADAFRTRDLQAVWETIHEDVAWHFPGRSFVAQEIRGRNALLEYLREILQRTSGTFILEDLNILGNDDHLLAVQRIGATHQGSTQKFEVVSVMRFAQGQQIERWFHVLDPEAFDAFFVKFG